MADATGYPQRMRYSFEVRCRAVALMVAGVRPAAAAHTVGASRASGYRWWARFKAEGWVGLQERRSTPKRQPRRLSTAAEATILAARERRGAGPLMLGALLGRPASTVGKVLRRLGCSRRPRAPRPPVLRYERAHPGELLHLDTKQLGRFWHVGKRVLRDGRPRSPRAGWQHVHIAIDDHSRLAYAEVRPSDRQADALVFLDRALAWFRTQGIARTRGGSGAPRTTCGTCAPAPTRSALTARPNASSKSCYATGRTRSPNPPAPSARARSPAGCGGITVADRTAPSVAVHPSAVSHTSVVSTTRPRGMAWAAIRGWWWGAAGLLRCPVNGGVRDGERP